MSSIADRIEEILAARDIKTRELARRAGFSTETQLANTLARLRKKPLAVQVDTLAQIAEGGGVRLEWLLTGAGPHDVESGPRLERPERYPNKRTALEALRAELHEKTPPLIESRIYHSTVDPPVSHWMREILELDRAVRWEADHPEEAKARRAAELARVEADAAARAAAKAPEIARAGLRGGEDLPPPPPKATKKAGAK